ncbi:MAG: hypothetical protein JKY98_00210 [Gammaproteobacteria bacterium]|nr:hypothetical protein [Gammaproteobacteria bacterium]
MNSPIFRMLLLTTLSGLILSCSPQDSESGGTVVESTFNTTLGIVEIMSMVLEPAADSLWDNAGWIESAAGYEELYPTTDEGWDYVIAQAAVVAESGNLLALPGRALDNDAWMVYSQGMIDAGLMAMDAAKRRHEEDFFQAGAQLYSVCRACHQSYNPDILSRFVEDDAQ